MRKSVLLLSVAAVYLWQATSPVIAMSIANKTTENKRYVVQGDMVLTMEQMEAMAGRKINPTWYSKWPSGKDGSTVIPYKFGRPSPKKASVKAAIARWEKETCLKFKYEPTKTTGSFLIFRRKRHCNSVLGKDPNSKTGQFVNLNRECEKQIGLILHELGHAIGFFHEQARGDRDKYVTVFLRNAKKKSWKSFAKHSDVITYDTPYDYTSIMHYAPTMFSKNGENTIEPKNYLAYFIMGEETELSYFDIYQANKRYKCFGKWLKDCKIKDSPCKNFGYVGKKCKCVCPPGTKGKNCETKEMEYIDALVKKATPDSRLITKPGEFGTPGASFPNGYKAVWQIKAPKSKKVQVTVEEFGMYFRMFGLCVVDYLKVGANTLNGGHTFCGYDLHPGMRLTSSNNHMIIVFKGYNYPWPHGFPGFKGTIEFV